MMLWYNRLYLFTTEEFEQLPDGIELTSIAGRVSAKGKDKFDFCTRSGYIAYGVKDPWNHPLKELFLIFKLKE